MPNITVRLPQGVFDGAARAKIAQGLNEVAKTVEQIGNDPANERLTWVVFDEIKSGCIFAGGADPTASIIPVIVWVRHPEGVIEQTGRESAVRLIHEVIADAAPKDGRPVVSSIAVEEVVDGTWAGSGDIWRLADFARIAGFKHLQHLVQPA